VQVEPSQLNPQYGDNVPTSGRPTVFGSEERARK
jgi:hypothetical protein